MNSSFTYSCFYRYKSGYFSLEMWPLLQLSVFLNGILFFQCIIFASCPSSKLCAHVGPLLSLEGIQSLFKKAPLSCVLLLVTERLASRNATKVIAVDDHTKPSSSSSSSSSSEMKREHSGNPDRLTPPPDPQGGSGIFTSPSCTMLHGAHARQNMASLLICLL